MQITGGKVSFSRSVQPAQYESKKAEVEITFTLAEGEALGTTLDLAAATAQNKALEMVGLQKPPAAVVAVAPPGAGQIGTKEAAAQAMNAAEPKKTSRPPKTPAAEKSVVVKPDPAALDDDVGHAAKIAENTVVNGDPKPQISINPEDRKDPADDLGDMLGAVKEITDEDLTNAIMQHNAKIKNPTAIRQLIIKFVGKTPCQARDLPKDKRAEFLVDLKKL